MARTSGKGDHSKHSKIENQKQIIWNANLVVLMSIVSKVENNQVPQYIFRYLGSVTENKIRVEYTEKIAKDGQNGDKIVECHVIVKCHFD